MELEKWSTWYDASTTVGHFVPNLSTSHTVRQQSCSVLGKRVFPIESTSAPVQQSTLPTENNSCRTIKDEGREEDEWLYGEGEPSSKPVNSAGEVVNAKDRGPSGDEESESRNGDNEGISKDVSETGPTATGEGDETAQGANDSHKEAESDEDDEDDSSDDDDDDGVKVVIGDIKSSSGQSPFGVGGPGVKRSAPPPDKKGKFAVEDFETPGTINGIPALEFSIDGVEDKPWRKPGADITDYFNYGFTEETWKAYTDRQKRMRFEAGGPQIMNPSGKQQDSRGVITVAFGQMQGQRSEMNRRREEPRENTIQVMTADRREYSRKNFEMGHPLAPPFDMSVPPPNFSGPPPGQDFMPNPEFFNHPPPQYYPDEQQGYEEQWMDHHTWDMEGMRGPPGGASSIVSLTKVSNVPPPPGDEDTGSSSVKDERNN